MLCRIRVVWTDRTVGAAVLAVGVEDRKLMATGVLSEFQEQKEVRSEHRPWSGSRICGRGGAVLSNLDVDVLIQFVEPVLETCEGGEVRGTHIGEVRAWAIAFD